MKKCYYKLENINIKLDRDRYGVLAHVANRKEMMDVAIRSHIVDNVVAQYDYEPIAQPLDELYLFDQPYDMDLSSALCLTSNLEVVVHHIKVNHPTTFVVAIDMPDDYNPLTNNYNYTDTELRDDIQQAIDRYMPLEFIAKEVR